MVFIIPWPDAYGSSKVKAEVHMNQQINSVTYKSLAGNWFRKGQLAHLVPNGITSSIC